MKIKREELQMNVYSKEWFVKNKERFERIYFRNDDCIKGISIPLNNRTPVSIEKKADEHEKNGEIDLWIAAWKMGRLDDNGQIVYTNSGNILNGYGKEINGLDDYIQSIDCNRIQKSIENGDYETAFCELAKNSPANFGTVYIITLMHFISKGEIPIYDKFAHKAIKAIFAAEEVKNIYVGDAPAKKNSNAAVNMLKEYMWLLKNVFGKSHIDRQTDRALWVYGHADKNFVGENRIKSHKCCDIE